MIAGLTSKLRVYLADEPVFPIAVLFALTWADQVDTQTFQILGPEIADHFNVGVGIFGTISLFVLLLVPFVAVPVSYLVGPVEADAVGRRRRRDVGRVLGPHRSGPGPVPLGDLPRRVELRRGRQRTRALGLDFRLLFAPCAGQGLRPPQPGRDHRRRARRHLRRCPRRAARVAGAVLLAGRSRRSSCCSSPCGCRSRRAIASRKWSRSPHRRSARRPGGCGRSARCATSGSGWRSRPARCWASACWCRSS